MIEDFKIGEIEKNVIYDKKGNNEIGKVKFGQEIKRLSNEEDVGRNK